MAKERLRKIPSFGRRNPSSERRTRYEDPVDRIRSVRRELDAERKRLGFSEREWLTYNREKNAKFEAKLRARLKPEK
jgi:hypothetical protein